MMNDKEFYKAQRKAQESIEGIKQIVKENSLEGLKITVLGAEMTVREMLLSWEGFENKPLEEQAVVMRQAMEFIDMLRETMENVQDFAKKIESVIK